MPTVIVVNYVTERPEVFMYSSPVPKIIIIEDFSPEVESITMLCNLHCILQRPLCCHGQFNLKMQSLRLEHFCTPISRNIFSTKRISTIF